MITSTNAEEHEYVVDVTRIEDRVRMRIEFPEMVENEYTYAYTGVWLEHGGQLLLSYRPETHRVSMTAFRKEFYLVGLPDWLVCLRVIGIFQKSTGSLHPPEYAIEIDMPSFLDRRATDCALGREDAHAGSAVER
jgi:hypothetical protein